MDSRSYDKDRIEDVFDERRFPYNLEHKHKGSSKGEEKVLIPLHTLRVLWKD